MEYSTQHDLDKGTCDIVLHCTKEQAAEALRALYEAELIECGHELTHTEGVDDTRYFDAAGNLQERSNPDVEVCDICGKIYNPQEEEWEDAQ